MRKYLPPVIMLSIFEIIAVTLWLTKDNIFYLFNFSYIGVSISIGMFLFIKENKHARRVVQLLVGLYMLVYLGLICQENMQIEGFWYYLFTGVFEAATIHYAVAKIQVYHFRVVIDICFGTVPGKGRQYREDHVLGFYYRQRSVLRCRYHTGICLQR